MNEADKTLEEEVRKKLLSNGEVDTHNFGIEVEEGVVKLEGDVSGRHAKKVVDECLSGMEGIRHVENKLKIRRISRFSDNSMHGF
ncbi:MAG: BON domain-containing protein [Bdellovibrionota bacterium]